MTDVARRVHTRIRGDGGRGPLACVGMLLAFAPCACTSEGIAASSPRSAANGSIAPGASGSSLERFFPLVDRSVYSYRTESLGDRPDSGVLTVRVRRTSATEGALLRPSGPQAFRFEREGIATTARDGTTGFVLGASSAADASWRGPHGGTTRVTARGVSAEVPAGRYEGCLTTLEERRGDAPLTVRTTLCPEVGIVALEVSAAGSVERASLTYYGPEIDLGGEGLRTDRGSR